MADDAPDVLVITIDGNHRFEFRPGDVTPFIARKVRKATGMSVAKAMTLAGDDPDLDVFASICYAAALQRDPDAKLADVDKLITYEAEYQVGEEEPDDGDDGEDPDADPET